MKAKDFFNAKEQKQLVDLIQKIEQKTSGELRVHIEDHCEINVLERAKEVFSRLEMNKTKLKNGVLLYIALEPKSLSIIGDTAIHQKVGQYFWNGTVEQLRDRFSKKEYLKGVKEAVEAIGEQLINYFPFNGENKNELPNEISF